MTKCEDRAGTIEFEQNGETFLRYQAETETRNPHVDVLAIPPGSNGPSGYNTVLAAPHDHQWHLGLFFCQKLVDGINCWAPREDYKQGTPVGVGESVDYEITETDRTFSVTQTVRWTTDSEQLLDDQREL